jgi:hypothetical protein
MHLLLRAVCLRALSTQARLLIPTAAATLRTVTSAAVNSPGRHQGVPALLTTSLLLARGPQLLLLLLVWVVLLLLLGTLAAPCRGPLLQLAVSSPGNCLVCLSRRCIRETASGARPACRATQQLCPSSSCLQLLYTQGLKQQQLSKPQLLSKQCLQLLCLQYLHLQRLQRWL